MKDSFLMNTTIKYWDEILEWAMESLPTEAFKNNI